LPEPTTPDESAHGALHQTLLWAETLFAAGDRSATHDYLARFYALADRFDYHHLRADGDRLGRQL
jgi:hypothetical protein